MTSVNTSGMSKADAKWHIKRQREMDVEQAVMDKASKAFLALAKKN